jgi:hypothetical protein
MSISENQRIPLPEANWVGTVYHAPQGQFRLAPLNQAPIQPSLAG